MCGIAGIVGGQVELADLQRMAFVQLHRGPDGCGVHLNSDRTAGLAHNRLSILDLSDAGHQPMTDGANLWLTFNGEIYNYLELRDQLSDYTFRTQSDTEVILAAYRKWGEQCVEKFIGMFSFAIWDESHKTLFCARDRLGIKPFHYTICNGQFLFASEIKALFAAGVEAKPDRKCWADYLVHGYSDHGERTFFDGILSLSAGTVMTVRDGEICRRSSYWNGCEQVEDPYTGSYERAAEELTGLIDDAVRFCLRSDVPVGVSLSGGLDSASLVTSVDRQSEGQMLETFTACFDDPRYDEVKFADEVPREKIWNRSYSRLGADEVEHEIELGLHSQEAPFGGVATLAMQKLHRTVKETGVKVLLEGQGVDEAFGGYAYFRPDAVLDLLDAGRIGSVKTELRSDPGTAQGLIETMRQRLRGNEKPVYQDGTSHLRPDCVAPAVRAETGERIGFSQPFDTRFENAMYRDLRYSKLPRVLRMHDRISMASSLEVRPPFLDHRVIEFAFRLSGTFKYSNGLGKRIWRDAMKTRLPDSVRLAPKRGVVVPQREWMRGPLQEWVRDIVESRRFAERGIFDPTNVKTEFDRFCAGEGENAFFPWQWINTELWFRRFVDTEPRHRLLEGFSRWQAPTPKNQSEYSSIN